MKQINQTINFLFKNLLILNLFAVGIIIGLGITSHFSNAQAQPQSQTQTKVEATKAPVKISMQMFQPSEIPALSENAGPEEIANWFKTINAPTEALNQTIRQIINS